MNYAQLSAFVASLHDATFNCPHCGHQYDGANSEIANQLVTYWGDEGETEFECDECSETFLVEEHVRRSFTVSTLEPEDA